MPSKTLQTTFKADGDLIDYMRQSGAGADQLKAKMAELKQASKGKEKNQRAADRDAAAAERREGQTGLQKLRDDFGARSGLGQIGRVLRGAGAVAGITLVSKALGDAAGKATELKAQFDAGRISGAAMAEGIVQSVPVLGTVYTAMHDVAGLLASFPALSESWVGKLAGLSSFHAAKQIEQEELARKALLDYQADALERQKKLMTELATLARHNARERGGANLEGYERERYDRETQQQEKLADLQQKRRQALDESEKDRQAKAEAIDKQNVSPQVKDDARATLAREKAGEAARINREFDAADRDQRAASAADAEAANRRHLESMAKVYAAYGREVADTQAAADVERLRALGRTGEAEAILARQQADDKKRAIDQTLQEQLKQASGPADRAALTADAAAAKAAVDRSAAMAQQNAVYKELRDAQIQGLQAQAAAGDHAAAAELRRVQAARQYEDELAKIQAAQRTGTDAEKAQAAIDIARLQAAHTAATADQLRRAELEILQERAAAGDAQAQQDAARLEHAEKVADLEARIPALKKDGTPEQIARAERDKAALDVAETERTNKQARDAHQAALRQRSEYGATAKERMAAAKELADTEIRQQFEQKRAAAQAILDNGAATAEQRKQARDDLNDAARQAGAEYDRKVYGNRPKVEHTFAAEDRGLLLTGVAAAAKNRHDPEREQAKLSAEANALARQLLDAVKDLKPRPGSTHAESVFGGPAR